MFVMKYKLLIFSIFTFTVFSSCSKELDLDEETQIAIEKQEILKKLDLLFDLAFEDPSKAEEDYNTLFTEELLRDGQNFIVDNDIRMRTTFTDLAIRLNIHFDEIKSQKLPESLFDIYYSKFESILLNRSLLGEIPQQIRKGDKLATFEAKVDEVSNFFDEKIKEIESNAQPNQNLLGKQWKATKWAIKPDYSAFYIMDYNFSFLADGGLEINNFYLYPLFNIRMGNQPIKAEESSNFPDDIANTQLSPAKFMLYNNKILFYFHLEANPNAADIKFNREWIYEFDYKLENNSLTFSNPRVMRFMHPFLYVGGYGTETYEELYFEDLRSVTLTAE